MSLGGALLLKTLFKLPCLQLTQLRLHPQNTESAAGGTDRAFEITDPPNLLASTKLLAADFEDVFVGSEARLR